MNFENFTKSKLWMRRFNGVNNFTTNEVQWSENIGWMRSLNG